MRLFSHILSLVIPWAEIRDKNEWVFTFFYRHFFSSYYWRWLMSYSAVRYSANSLLINSMLYRFVFHTDFNAWKLDWKMCKQIWRLTLERNDRCMQCIRIFSPVVVQIELLVLNMEQVYRISDAGIPNLFHIAQLKNVRGNQIVHHSRQYKLFNVFQAFDWLKVW